MAFQKQLDTMVESSKKENEPIAESLVAMFAALRSTLETIAANEVNSPRSKTHYTISPRNIIDSGESMSFVRDCSAISYHIKHVRTLITAEGRHTKSSHAGKLQITIGSRPIFVKPSSF